MLAARSVLRPYPGFSRGNFPFSTDGLVFYLPLWQTDMQGSPVLSYDSSPISGTVTGATWGKTGRTFDGTDDKIAFGTPAALNLTVLSMVGWVNAAAAASGYFFSKRGDANVQYQTVIDSTKLQIGGGAIMMTSDTVVADSTWHCIGCTMNDTAGQIFADATENQSGAITAPSAQSENVYIGCRGEPAAAFFEGIVGEIAVYSRAISNAEFLAYRQATMWRYAA